MAFPNSEVNRVCQCLDAKVQAHLQSPLAFSCYPYVYLDVTCLHGWDPARKQVLSRAVIVAVGITASGQGQLLGIEVGDSFWVRPEITSTPLLEPPLV